ncbi:partial Fe(3+) ions import ATP-binding protein FbpC 2, partial [Planctomycetaceae bacterium]
MAGATNIDMSRARGEGQLRSQGPVIKVDHLTKIYDDKKVLDDISFELARGKVYVVMGPSGCGKSTLLRMMIGAEEVSGGHVFLDGVDITTADKKTHEEARRKFGVL